MWRRSLGNSGPAPSTPSLSAAQKQHSTSSRPRRLSPHPAAPSSTRRALWPGWTWSCWLQTLPLGSALLELNSLARGAPERSRRSSLLRPAAPPGAGCLADRLTD